MEIKTVLFDLDGTLTASGEGITKSVQYALCKLGREAEDLKALRTLWQKGKPRRWSKQPGRRS